MSKEHIDNADAQDENKLIAARREKLESIRERRVAFPNDFTPSASSEKLIAQHEAKDKATLEGESIQVSVAGRIVRMRGPVYRNSRRRCSNAVVYEQQVAT